MRRIRPVLTKLACRGLAAATFLAMALAATTRAQEMAVGAPPPAVAPEGLLVGRIALVQGAVSLRAGADAPWIAAELNYPVTAGAGLWTAPGGRAELQIGHARLDIDGGTELEVTTIDENMVALAVSQGRVDIRLHYRRADERYAIATPRGTVDMTTDGFYRIVAGGDAASTRVAVFDGAAIVSSPANSISVDRGVETVIASLDPPSYAANAAHPDPFDRWAMDRGRLEAPPPSPDVAEMPGYGDLGAYGIWRDVPEYGAVWLPRAVAPDWAPYRSGHWRWVEPWGWTWVDDEPWGFAPFHYGRWMRIEGSWAWVPGAAPAAGPPVFAPALVAFVATPAEIVAGEAGPCVGWFPLAPGEPYEADWRHRDRHDIEQASRATNVPNVYRNRTFVTVVNQNTFVNARPVQRAVLPVHREAQVRPAATAEAAGLPTMPGAHARSDEHGVAMRAATPVMLMPARPHAALAMAAPRQDRDQGLHAPGGASHAGRGSAPPTSSVLAPNRQQPILPPQDRAALPMAMPLPQLRAMPHQPVATVATPHPAAAAAPEQQRQRAAAPAAMPPLPPPPPRPAHPPEWAPARSEPAGLQQAKWPDPRPPHAPGRDDHPPQIVHAAPALPVMHAAAPLHAAPPIQVARPAPAPHVAPPPPVVQALPHAVAAPQRPPSQSPHPPAQLASHAPPPQPHPAAKSDGNGKKAEDKRS